MGFPAWGAAAIQSGGGIFSSIINGLFNKGTQNKDIAFQREMQQNEFAQQLALMDKQYQQNIDMFNMTNEYNDPSNELARLRAAGINPSMMLGQTGDIASAVGGSAPTAPVASMPNFQTPWNFQFGDDFGKGMATYLEQKRLENETNKTNQDIKESESKINVNDTVVGLNQDELENNKVKRDEMRAHIREMNTNADKLGVAMDDLREHINLQIAQEKHFQNMDEVAKQQLAINRYDALTRRITANSAAELNRHLAKKYDSDVRINDENVKLIAQNVKKSYEETQSLKIKNHYQGKQYEIELEINKGRAKIMGVDAWIKEKGKYAEVADMYIGSVDHLAQTISHSAKAIVNVANPMTTVAPESRKSYSVETSDYSRKTQEDYWHGYNQFSFSRQE